jgi:lysophospholipase L1-like esterase
MMLGRPHRPISSSRLPLHITAVLLWVTLTLPVFGDVPSPTAPTPYPVRATDWPGHGVIRVFDWMKDNRAHFWRERERKQRSLVFAGDSLTAQWPDLAADFPAITVANRGIGGDVSRGLLFRFEEDVLALDPKGVVILIGTNDLTARQAARDTLRNIESMIELAAQHSPRMPFVLCTVPPSAHPKAPVDPEQRKILNAGLRAIAARSDEVSLVDLYAATAMPSGDADPKWFKSDRLHLNEAGYEQWKASLKPVLREHGIL